MGADKAGAPGNQSTHQTLLGTYTKLVWVKKRFRGRTSKTLVRQLLVQKGKLPRHHLPSTSSFAPAVHKGAPSRQQADCTNSGYAQILFRRSPFLGEVQAAAAGTEQLLQSGASRGAPGCHYRISPTLLLREQIRS